MAELTVALHGGVIGTLSDRGAAFDFTPTGDAVRRYGLGSRVLSAAIPLAPRPAASTRPVRQNFFAELLPEGDARRRLALEAGLDADDVIAMLRVYGRDVAGAIQVWDAALPGEPRTPATEPLDDEGVARLLRDVGIHPLGNKPRRGKTSLNGVQDKIVLVRTETGWARSLDGFPSTHIVKPIVGRYPSMIFDEEYGSRFARVLGLADFSTEVMTFAGEKALVIERYDRSGSAADGRIHQEDFNQVLGCRGDQKYEIYGKRGLSDVAKILTPGDREKLLRMVTLSIAVGNLDMHLKNIALLHDADGGYVLAPMYDVVPQHFPEYDNDGELALSVVGVFDYAQMHRDLIVEEAEAWGVADASTIVDEALSVTLEVAQREIPHSGAHPGLQQLIVRTTESLLAGRTVIGTEPGAPGEGPRPAAGRGAWEWPNARAPRVGGLSDDPPLEAGD